MNERHDSFMFAEYSYIMNVLSAEKVIVFSWPYVDRSNEWISLSKQVTCIIPS